MEWPSFRPDITWCSREGPGLRLGLFAAALDKPRNALGAGPDLVRYDISNSVSGLPLGAANLGATDHPLPPNERAAFHEQTQ